MQIKNSIHSVLADIIYDYIHALLHRVVGLVLLLEGNIKNYGSRKYRTGHRRFQLDTRKQCNVKAKPTTIQHEDLYCLY